MANPRKRREMRLMREKLAKQVMEPKKTKPEPKPVVEPEPAPVVEPVVEPVAEITPEPAPAAKPKPKTTRRKRTTKKKTEE